MFVCCCSFASRFRLCFMPVQGNATVQERSFFHIPDPVRLEGSVPACHHLFVTRESRQSKWPPMAVVEIERLKAAIAALGDSTAYANPLKEALRVGQPRASIRPVEERVESCKLFLERARKRVERAQAFVDRGSGTESSVRGRGGRGRSEVRETLGRGGHCRCSYSCLSAGDRTSGTDQCVCVGTRRSACSPSDPWNPQRSSRYVDGRPSPVSRTSHPMPTSDMQDLAGWMSQRNCELRNAMEFGDHLLVAKIGSLVGQGASLFSTAGSRRANGGEGQVVIDVESNRRGRRETSVCDRRQCK